MRRVLLAFAVALAVVAPTARADIGLVSISRTSGRPGDRVVARFGGYDRQWPRFPVYLVREPWYPKTPACCEPRVRHPPRGGRFTFLGRVHYGAPQHGRFVFHVPRLRPGTYGLVIYCAPCYKGPDGSLIATGPRFRIRR
jgi:hypothetical protein